MEKIAIIVIELVPEAKEATHSQIETEIAKSLQCDWMKTLERVTVLDREFKWMLNSSYQQNL
ncbi:MAG: hypothetical protein NWF01_10285 [Candidatus Bathyarchaeota archaeon]|nr:hypothetical protein [Candidatus Bathyarchaeota archaeon]